ncbi:MAG: hypothetical protein ACTHMD_02195 [Flavisolibacter sp.]
MKSILLFTSLAFTLTDFAQDSSFQLKDYQYRTPGFKALSINVNFSGSINNTKAVDLTQKKDRNFYLLPSRFSYNGFVSTDKRTHATSLSFTPSFLYYNTNNDGSSSKSRTLQYNLSWYNNDRFYKNSKWFFELGNQLTNMWENNREKDTVLNNRYRSMQLEDKISFGFGKGRIEMVQDAQMALYILNDLQEQGLLQDRVTPEVAGNFAKLITNINNKRVFDTRKRRVYELTQIDSFLRSSGLLNRTDIRHFTIINDNWALAFNPGRLSGSDWFIRIQPSAGLQKTTSSSDLQAYTSDSRYLTKFFALAPVIGYEKFVPVNLKWQRNMTASLSWKTTWANEDSKTNSNGSEIRSIIKRHEPEVRLSASYGMGYYPSNRAAINTNLQIEATHVEFDNSSWKNATTLSPSVNLSADCFISYKTRLSFNWSLFYYKSFINPVLGNQIEIYNFNTNVSFGFSHVIF